MCVCVHVCVCMQACMNVCIFKSLLLVGNVLSGEAQINLDRPFSGVWPREIECELHQTGQCAYRYMYISINSISSPTHLS